MDKYLSSTIGLIPEGWNVVWCPNCGRSVTWTDEDMKSYGETWWMGKATSMLVHDCETPVPEDWRWFFCERCNYTVTFDIDVHLQFSINEWSDVIHDAFAHNCQHYHSDSLRFNSR